MSFATVVALLLFTATIATPHPGLFFHVHADGERVHVHPDDADVGPHHDDRDHHDHLHTSGRHPDSPEIEAPDPPGGYHWHTQSPFHRAIAPAAVEAACVRAAEPARAAVARAVTHLAVYCGQPRAPPAPPHA